MLSRGRGEHREECFSHSNCIHLDFNKQISPFFFHFFQVCGGYSTTVEYISLLKAFVEETDPVVWTDILLNINKLNHLFELTDVYEQFKSFVISLLLPLSERIGPVSLDTDSKLYLNQTTFLLCSALLCSLYFQLQFAS